MTGNSTAQMCRWCGTHSENTPKRAPLCHTCSESITQRCLAKAEEIWRAIPWDSQSQIERLGQYIDSRFVCEVFDLHLQDLFRKWRLQIFGSEGFRDVEALTLEEAVEIVQLYAPNRWDIYRDDPKRVIDRELQPVLELITDNARMHYEELGGGLAQMRDWLCSVTSDLPPRRPNLEDPAEQIMAEVQELLPSGPIFLHCLAVGVVLGLTPSRVFRHAIFDESIVDEPWGYRNGQLGPYLGRFPPTRWKNVGLKMPLRNLIRLWCSFCIERLTGRTARAATRVWDEARFHDHWWNVETERAGSTVTQGYEPNYKRQKDWLRRRMRLWLRPFEDMPNDVQRALGTRGIDPRYDLSSWDKWMELLEAMQRLGGPPRI